MLSWGMQVRGQSLLPAAAMVEAAFATCKITVEKVSKSSVPTLGQGSIPAPLIWTPASAATLHVHVSSEAGVPQVSVQSATAGNKTRPVLHLHAKLGQAVLPTNPSSLHIPVLQILVAGRSPRRSVIGCPCAAMSNAWEASTYHAYPPVLDACMHVGAVASQSPNPDASASQLRIPSGFALYSVTTQAVPRSAWACASDLKAQDDGSALSTYSLATPSPSLLLRDLTARQLRRAQASDPRAPVAGGLRDLLYGITWKAADPWPLGTPKTRSFGRQRIQWNVDGKVLARIGNAPLGTAEAGTAGAVTATVTAVALSQTVLQMRQGRIVHVVTRGGGRHAWESGMGRQAITGMASSAVAAVVRTAQQESSGNQWAAVDVGVALAGSVASASLPADGTSTLASSTVYKPQLYQSENAPIPGLLPHTGAERVGAVIIGGGAGGIGSLLCLWEGHNYGKRLYLLSRTAHGGEPQHALSHHAITIAKCDVASQEDVAGFHRALGAVHTGSPVTGMFHAGGVLRDATLPNLSSGAVRAVFAPKVGGILAMQSALTRLPVNATWVFSSTGALLGPMGQANYGAANAAANAWAAYLQSQGSFPPLKAL